MPSEIWNGSGIYCAFCVCCFGTMTTVIIMEEYQLTTNKKRHNALLQLAALSLGGMAMWTAQRVGAKARVFQGHSGEYFESGWEPIMTFASLLVQLVATFIGLKIAATDPYFAVSNDQRIKILTKTVAEKTNIKDVKKGGSSLIRFKALYSDLTKILLGGLVTATGLAVGTFMSLAATVYHDLKPQYSAGTIVASVILSLFAASIAYWFIFRFLPWKPSINGIRRICAFVLAIAITGQLLVAMASQSFIPGESLNDKLGVYGADLYLIGYTIGFGCVYCFSIILWLLKLQRTKARDAEKKINKVFEVYLKMAINRAAQTNPEADMNDGEAVQVENWLVKVLEYLAVKSTLERTEDAHEKCLALVRVITNAKRRSNRLAGAASKPGAGQVRIPSQSATDAEVSVAGNRSNVRGSVAKITSEVGDDRGSQAEKPPSTGGEEINGQRRGSQGPFGGGNKVEPEPQGGPHMV